MQSPDYSSLFFFFFILQLSLQPGDSSSFKCGDKCKGLQEKIPDELYQRVVKNGVYNTCPHNIIEFKLPKGVICGVNHPSLWAYNATKSIDQRKTASLPEPSENQHDFSKGSKEKPPTTTQEPPTSTTKAAPPLSLSTQTWRGGTLKPTEIPREEPDTTQKNNASDLDQLQGNEPPTEKDEQESKMKNMTIAVISLILIVLVMTSVGVYVWCRRPNFPKCQSHCAEDAVEYHRTPSEDPLQPKC